MGWPPIFCLWAGGWGLVAGGKGREEVFLVLSLRAQGRHDQTASLPLQTLLGGGAAPRVTFELQVVTTLAGWDPAYFCAVFATTVKGRTIPNAAWGAPPFAGLGMPHSRR